jgi:formate-dependent nitrite reductase membrane component NrfD
LRSRDWTKRALAVPLSCHKSFFSILLILLLFIFVFLCRYPGAGIAYTCRVPFMYHRHHFCSD